MLFIQSESGQARMGEGSLETIEGFDRSNYDARHALDQIEIPTWRLYLSFEDGEPTSSAGEVPKMWTLRSNS